MYKYKIEVVTFADVKNLVKTAELYPESVGIMNGDGTRHGQARTMLSVLESVTWDEAYLISGTDCYNTFKQFIVE